MQHSLVEVGQSPDSPSTLTPTVTEENEPTMRFPRLRLYFYILRGVLLLALTVTVFSNGVMIIRQNARTLGLFSLNLSVPLPFLLIGLWGIAVLTLSICFFMTLSKICLLLTHYYRRTGRS